METTITLEFISETKKHLEELAYELKQVHDTQILLVEPEDKTVPVLISIGIGKKGERADLAIKRITHVLYDFLHSSTSNANQKKLTLVTIEGENIDIAPLNYEQIEQVITDAYKDQDA